MSIDNRPSEHLSRLPESPAMAEHLRSVMEQLVTDQVILNDAEIDEARQLIKRRIIGPNHLNQTPFTPEQINKITAGIAETIIRKREVSAAHLRYAAYFGRFGTAAQQGNLLTEKNFDSRSDTALGGGAETTSFERWQLIEQFAQRDEEGKIISVPINGTHHSITSISTNCFVFFPSSNNRKSLNPLYFDGVDEKFRKEMDRRMAQQAKRQKAEINFKTKKG